MKIAKIFIATVVIAFLAVTGCKSDATYQFVFQVRFAQPVSIEELPKGTQFPNFEIRTIRPLSRSTFDFGVSNKCGNQFSPIEAESMTKKHLSEILINQDLGEFEIMIE